MTDQHLPTVIIDIIADYAMINAMVSWMRDIENNPEMEHITEYKLDLLWANPMAEDELRPWINSDKINGEYLSRNSADWALDILESNPEYRNDTYLVRNTNPRILSMIESKIPDWINKQHHILNYFIKNPVAVNIIKKYNLHTSNRFLLSSILSNPSDQIPEILGDKLYDLDWVNTLGVMSNPAPWAINLIKKYGVYLCCDDAYKNPDPFVCSNILANIEDIWEKYPFWHELINKNPGLINHLRERPDRISCHIWRNPAIFEPARCPKLVNLLTELTW